MQPPYRGQRGRGGQIGQHEGGTGAQRLFHRPQHIFGTAHVDQDQPPGCDQPLQAVGIKPLGQPK